MYFTDIFYVFSFIIFVLKISSFIKWEINLANKHIEHTLVMENIYKSLLYTKRVITA